MNIGIIASQYRVGVSEPDTEAPSIPTGLMETATTETSFTVVWNASTDNVGVTGYEVSINNGTAIDVGNVLTYTKSDATEDTTYAVKVRAYDLAGNYSDYCANINVTTDAEVGDTEDPTAPTGVIITNTGLDPTRLSWTAATDNEGIAGYDIYCMEFEGVEYFKWNTSIIADLFYDFEPNYPTGGYWTFVRAIDTSGNYADSSATFFGINETGSSQYFDVTTFASTKFSGQTCNILRGFPVGHAQATLLPCIIMLHGLGQFGTTASGIWENGPARYIQSDSGLVAKKMKDILFICPQQPVGVWEDTEGAGGDAWSMTYIMEIYNDAVNNHKADPDNISIWGLSMGARAALHFASENPTLIHKCLAMAGSDTYADPEVFANDVPVWLIHGTSDNTGGGFDHTASSRLADDINDLGGTYEALLTRPTGIGHSDPLWDEGVSDATGFTAAQCTADANGNGLDPIGNPDNNPYEWTIT